MTNEWMKKKWFYRPSAVGRFHVAVDFDVPETGAAYKQVVDSRFGKSLLLEFGARVALLLLLLLLVVVVVVGERVFGSQTDTQTHKKKKKKQVKQVKQEREFHWMNFCFFKKERRDERPSTFNSTATVETKK